MVEKLVSLSGTKKVDLSVAQKDYWLEVKTDKLKVAMLAGSLVALLVHL